MRRSEVPTGEPNKVPTGEASKVPTREPSDVLSEQIRTEDIGKRLRGLPCAPAFPPPSVRYGIACAAAERAGKADDESTLVPVWENLLVALKGPDPWAYVDPSFASIRASARTAPTLRALLSRGQSGLALAEFGPIGAPGARALAGEGILTADELLRAAADPVKRADLATATEYDAAVVESWAHLAELAVVLELACEGKPPDGTPPRGIGNLVTLASLATITDVKTMAVVNPPIVAAAMDRSNRLAQRLAGLDRAAYLDIVGRWKAASAEWLGNVGREGATSMVQPAPAVSAPTNGEGDDDKEREKKSGTDGGGDNGQTDS